MNRFRPVSRLSPLDIQAIRFIPSSDDRLHEHRTSGGVTWPAAAGSQRAQTTGSDVERTQHDATDRERQIDSDLQADAAAGIAEPDGKDLEANDRDADGRRPWETPAANRQPSRKALPGRPATTAMTIAANRSI